MREAKKADTQLAKELKAQNLGLKKVPSKKTKAVVPKPKKSALTMPKATKVPKEQNPCPKLTKKAPKKVLVVDEPKEVVVTTTRQNQQIVLPQHFKK